MKWLKCKWLTRKCNRKFYTGHKWHWIEVMSNHNISIIIIIYRMVSMDTSTNTRKRDSSSISVAHNKIMWKWDERRRILDKWYWRWWQLKEDNMIAFYISSLRLSIVRQVLYRHIYWRVHKVHFNNELIRCDRWLIK